MLQSKLKPRFTRSLTSLLLVLGFLVALFAPRWDGLDFIDAQMFRLGTWLLPVPDVNDDILTATLPSNLFKDPQKIKQLRQLLKKFKDNKSASVALLMSSFPMLDYQLKESKKEESEWELTGGELTKLAWVLKKYDVLMGQPVINQHTHTVIKKDNESYSDYLQGMIFTKVSPVSSRFSQHIHEYQILPYSNSVMTCHKMPLIWSDNNGVIIDLSLGIYRQAQRYNNYDWFDKQGIKLDKKIIRTDYAGHVMGYFSASNVLSVKKVDFEKLLSFSKNKIKNKIFIIGDNERDLTLVANNLASLLAEATYHMPAWASWAKKMAFVVVLIYLIVFVARLQKNTSYLLSVLLFFSVMVLQYGLLIIQSVWMPLVSLYAFLIFGHFLMSLKKSLDSKMDALSLRTHEALWHLGQYQYENGDHDRALTNLLKCSPTLDVLETMYNIGLGFERRRQYDKALHLFSELDVRDGGFKDVKKRLKTLLDVMANVSGNQVDISSPVQAAKTLVMPDMGLQLPVFGRYEIERELGRGAMGVVYLGKDPKINRQVAIKTLDYSQFSENEIKTIKSRFFREAEAAGRLNHNNIVTVYDVGEEADFAFIAMDYVKGMTLGEFTRPQTLLPVHEVYEIIAEVAETLEYAHSQNIVHRDIKPSNIMYDPDTHKIKITDFGIARITDSVRTRTGSFMGSPSYMAPEQMTGANVDNHADIYSLGVSFYQLLTGTLPFEADSIGNLAYLITNEKHKPVREVRPELPASASRIINKALQKKPDDRYNTGKDMADAIRRGMPDNAAS